MDCQAKALQPVHNPAGLRLALYRVERIAGATQWRSGPTGPEIVRMAIRVLIANSSGIAREIIRNHLECMGCNVVAEAETAAQTINLFRTVRPQVITLDLGLRPSGGLDALEVFRSIRHEAPEASVMIMGATDDGDKSRIFLNEGALDCIVEPFDSAGVERMWRCWSEHYPELRRTEPAPTLPVAGGSRGGGY